ncbi:MAG TPA: GNAT family N-acetyltransferase [Polyangiales bacterium]|nr:GNAT family N-acetyltransferase [Polyangiales bacterium]
MTLEVVTTLDRLEALGTDYAQLYRTAGVDLPFQLQEWHIAWWKAFASASLRIRDHLFFHVIRSAADGCVAILPLVLTERPGNGPVRIGTLALIGTDQYITEVRSSLIVPAHERAVGSVLARSLAEDSRWDWAHWTGLSDTLAATLGSLGEYEQRDPTLDYVLDLAPTWDEFKSGLKRNIRESIRHCYNSLKRDGYAAELEVASGASIRRGLDEFVRLHAARADLGDTIEHPDRFASAMARGFLYDVCERLTARDVSRVFLLKIAGEVVAARVAFQVNDALYLYYSGFDPKWRKYSVMTTLVTEAIKHAIDRKLKLVNLSAGTDVSKTRWGARPVTFAETLQRRSRVRSRIASKVYEGARTANTNHPVVRALLKALPRRQWG